MPIDTSTITTRLNGPQTLSELVVVGFTITEELSRPYRATIELITPGPADPSEIDLDQVLTEEYAIITTRAEEDYPFHGIVISAEHLGDTIDRRQRYQIELAPQLWLTSLMRRTRSWANVTVTDVLQDVLNAAQVDIDPKFSASYPTMDHITQFEETDFEFVSRLMEHEGICYWFKHTADGHLMVLGDAANAHPPANQGLPILFDMGATGQGGTEVGSLTSFTRRHKVVMKEVVVRDYDPHHPTTPHLGRKTVRTPRGTAVSGISEEADHHILGNAGEADRYATMRGEEQACQRELHHGKGSVPALHAGSPFNLRGSDVNEDDYLVVTMTHTWKDAAASKDAKDKEGGFKSTFSAIRRSLLPWRPARTTPIPRISGLVTGKILATAGEQDSDHLDGAYRVAVLCEGQTTERIVRMAQPYAGPDQGIHFPLPPDTEVVLGHLHGHPDRPIIAGALPNVENPSPVMEANKTQCVVKTAAGHSLVFEDKGGDEAITLTSPKGNMLCFSDKDDLVTLNAAKDHKVTIAGKSDSQVTGPTTFACNDEITITAANKITIGVGSSVITMTPSGITIETPELTMTASGALKMAGATLDAKADGLFSAKGADMTLAADSATKIGAANISITGNASVKASAPQIEVAASGMAKLTGNASCNVEGAMINIKGTGVVAIKGAMITNN